MRAVLARLDRFQSYETTADPRHVSGPASVRRLLDDLGRPDRRLRVIHVAGTHGKGLTSAMIAAALECDGLPTGLYTSPHVLDVREEIVIGGRWIPERDFARLAGAVVEVAEGYKGRVHLSRFDLMTATALLAFADAGVDLAVIEAGLGGREDSTNVTDKCLAVVTPIDFDHVAILGAALAEIAEHKLGIVRPGVPVVVAEQEPALEDAMRRELAAAGCPASWSRELAIRAAGEAGRWELLWPDGDVQALETERRIPVDVYFSALKTALLARTALAVGDVSTDRRLRWARAALAVSLPGRLEYRTNVGWRGGEPFDRVVLDGGHSPGALRACARQLAAWGLDEHTLILGLARDKLGDPLRRPLVELCAQAREIVATAFESPRAAKSRELAAFLCGADPGLAPRIREAGSVAASLELASAERRRPLVIAGSFYLLQEMCRALTPKSLVPDGSIWDVKS